MAPPSILTVSTVRTTASTGTTSSTPLHFSLFFLAHFGCGGEKGAALDPRIYPMHHRTRATPLHVSTPVASRPESIRGGRKEIRFRAEQSSPTGPAVPAAARSAVPLCCLWTPLHPLTWREESRRCGAVRWCPLVTSSPFHLFPLPRLVFLGACPPLIVPCALLPFSPLSSPVL